MSTSPNQASRSTPKRTGAAASKAAVAPAGFSVHPRDIWRMFLERWWVGALVAVPAVVAFIVFQPKPEVVYQTEASLLFETRANKVLPVQAVVDTTVTRDAELNVHLEQIRSQTFFEALQASFTADEIDKIQRPYRDPERPDAPPPSLAAIIGPRVKVYARKGTTIMGISIFHRDPEAAALIANRYARKYIDFNIDLAMTGTNSAIVFLRNQAEDTRKEVEEAERNLQQYRAKYNMAALGENQNVVLKKVASLGESLVGAQLNLVSLQEQLDKVETYLRENRDLQEISYINGFGGIAATRNQIDGLLAARRHLEERYLEEHPKMKDNALALDNARKHLAADIDLAIADLRTRTAFAASYVAKLKTELASAENDARALDKISVDYKFLEQFARTKQDTYRAIMNRLNDANISAQMENTNIKVFDRAYIPSSPINRGKGQIAAKAGALGVLLLFSLPLGLGFLDTRIKSTSDIEDKLQTRLLAGVRLFKNIPTQQHATVFRDGSDDALVECYRGLYSEIELRSDIPTPKVLLVASSVPGEGKSVTSANLAAVFAAHGRRTLIVDCDFRRPSQHRLFGVPNDRGVLRWAQDHRLPDLATAEEEDLGIRLLSPNLHLLSAGGAVKKPTEIIERLAVSPLFDRLKRSFDIVILDTPPSAVFPDALLLARHAAEVIYVTKFKTVRRSLVKKTLAKYDETGAYVLGVVLNQLPRSRVLSYDYDGYGAYGKDYYQAYGEKESTKA
ncbi:MAG: polysaccharide biosynthesis tyrosine autokinase [Opitutaceae bacterium]